MSKEQLVLEILSGPLDGHEVTIEKETAWSKKGEGPLIFPWDKELGEPQARFFKDGDEWSLEVFQAKHGTYCLNRQTNIGKAVKLRQRDMLKASQTWLMVRQVE
jgi:hypothetical protein